MQGYSWVALTPSWKAGLLLCALTFLDYGIGLIGFASAVCARYAGQLAGADANDNPVCVFNGLLTGLFVGHTWAPGIAAALFALLGGVFSGWLTIALGRLTWSLMRLPVLSLPFAMMAMLASMTGGSLSMLKASGYVAPPGMLGVQADRFLSAFGNLYFLPDPFIGLYVLAVMLIFSRYYIVIATAGYLSAMFCLEQAGAAPEHLAATAWDSNAMLAALLVGGLFATPSLLTAALGILAAVMAGWLSLSFGRMLDPVHLAPFSAPFVFIAWIMLYAAVRNPRLAGSFHLLTPDLPERSYVFALTGHARAKSVAGAIEGDVHPLQLLAGRGLRYTVTQGERGHSDWTLSCEVDAQGRFILVSGSGARCVVESGRAVFSCVERNDVADRYLDLWLLACGHTPSSIHVDQWHDRCKPAAWLPHRAAKFIALMAWPWMAFAESHYRRHWDAYWQAWCQEGHHRQKGTRIQVRTTAWIVPQLGCSYLTAEVAGTRYTLQATSVFQRADAGIPAWETAIGVAPLSGKAA